MPCEPIETMLWLQQNDYLKRSEIFVNGMVKNAKINTLREGNHGGCSCGYIVLPSPMRIA